MSDRKQRLRDQRTIDAFLKEDHALQMEWIRNPKLASDDDVAALAAMCEASRTEITDTDTMAAVQQARARAAEPQSRMVAWTGAERLKRFRRGA